jgi:DNA-binding NarL/FixJ family response regulator
MNPITVSIVEDLAEIRESLEKLVRVSEDFLLLSTYSNAETAQNKIPEERPQIVIMDINLPGISGIDCIRAIKNSCPDTQFIMYTIFEDDDKVFEALEAGASGYLLKKTPKEKIMEALMELYEGGSPMSTQIARKVIRSFQQKDQLNAESDLLTPKQKEVLELLAKGFLYKEISEKLQISLNTVKQHIHKTYLKLHVCNRTEAVIKIYGKN